MAPLDRTMEPGVALDLSPLVRRIVAPNAGFMTGPGTNSYLVGREQVAVIDPGPADEGHIRSIVQAGAGRIRWILYTHTHPDHAPGAIALKDMTGAEIVAYDASGGSGTAWSGALWPEAGELEVDRTVRSGAVIGSGEFELRVLETPGHASDHLCFILAEEQALFSGDHVIEGSTSAIIPPDGDMADYIDSLEATRAVEPVTIVPGHGEVIEDPSELLDDYIAHRLERELQVLEVVDEIKFATIDAIVGRIYVALPDLLVPLAGCSVQAHLLKLEAEGRVTPSGDGSSWSPA